MRLPLKSSIDLAYYKIEATVKWDSINPTIGATFIWWTAPFHAFQTD